MEKALGIECRRFARTVRMFLAVLLAFFGSGACIDICRNVSNSYQREFGEPVPKPACPPATSCTNPGTTHLTSTAYLPSGNPGERRLLVMHLASDGNALQSTYEGRTKYERNQKPIPAGTFKVLTVLVTYAQTIGANGLTLLEQAQATINDQHASFATGHGYSAPLVRFVFTNLSVPGSEIPDPNSLAGVRNALGERPQTQHLNVSDFDFIVVLNIDPGKSEGGWSSPGSPAPYFVYMGNYSNWQTILSASDFVNVSRAAYHHEIGHYWGWQHDWTCGSFDPFITAPTLFGWVDTDGDGIPEILDPNPYGRECDVTPADPEIRFNHKDAEGRISIPVVNWSVYSNEMFRQAPELPPCGLNANSSRTWVDIYNADTNARVYGFCALSSKSNLKKIWFTPAAGIQKVYIIMNDRACNKRYRSNTVSWH